MPENLTSKYREWTCYTCKKVTLWRKGFALVNPYVDGRGRAAAECSRGVTISRNGPARIAEVWKCKGCGRSVASAEKAMRLGRWAHKRVTGK